MGWNPFSRRPSWDGLGEKALTATPAVLDGIRSGWAPYPLLGGGSRQRIVEAFNKAQTESYAWVYANSPAVRTVVDTIVRNVGQLDLRLYEEIDEKERQARPDHPAALSFRYPNEETAAASFIRAYFKDFLLFDNAYAFLQDAPGNRLSVHRLPAHMIEVLGSSLFRAEGYRLWRIDGSTELLLPEQVMHWHGENPSDPRVGLSRLDTLRSVIAEDAALQQATIELANAGLTEPVWAFRPLEAPPMTPEIASRFEEDLTNRVYRRNRKIVLTQEGTELRSFGVSPKDAQMMEIRRWAIEQVAREFGVPLGMVGLSDDIEEARSQFYADTLPPYCEDFTRFANHRVLVRVYNWTDGCFEFNLDEKHMGDNRLTALVSATGRPVMLTNEARAKLNLPPVEGGDELVTPMNVLVGENPQATVDQPNPADPNGQPRGVALDEEPKALLKAVSEPIPQLIPARKADLDRQYRHIDLAQAAVERHFTRLERSLRAKAGDADWNRWDREFATDLNGLLERIVETEGAVYALKLGGVEFDMARVVNYLRAMAEGAAEGINAKVRQEIGRLGLEAALNLRSQHVESAGAGLGAGATRWAREEAARQAPGTEQRVKVWVANSERHAEFDGVTVPLGADWPAGFAPGAAPGCRCTQAIL